MKFALLFIAVGLFPLAWSQVSVSSVIKGSKSSLATFQSSLKGSGKSQYRESKHHEVKSRIGTDGKLLISKKEDPSNDKNAVEFRLCEIDELDAMDNKIGSNSPTPRSFTEADLKAKTFSLGNPQSSTAGTGSGGNAIKTQKTTSSMSLSGSKMLKMSVSSYDSSGNVTAGPEKIEVSSGDIELDFELSGWSFCSQCTSSSQSGDQIEMKFCVKSKKVPTKKSAAQRSRKLSGGAEEFELGDNGNMVLSSQLYCDGSWKSMKTGFPTIKANSDGSSEVAIRMPKFTKSCLWDPTITASTASGANLIILSMSSVVLAVFAKLL